MTRGAAYEREAIARAIKVKLGRSTVRFISVEDLVVHKIIAGRPRDMEDAMIVLIKNPHCDRTYIRRWLKEYDAALDEKFTARFKDILRHPD